MKISDLMELITFDLVIEVMGLLFVIGLLWGIFFGGGINLIIEMLVEYVC